MSPTNATGDPQVPKTPIGALGQALTLVFKGIALAKKGLENNPSVGEARDLNDTIHDLEIQRFAIEAKIDALIDKLPGLTGPTPDQVAKISALTTEVAGQIIVSVMASAAVQLTTRVLAVATQVAAGAPVV
jgi:hypothetical protein